MLCRIGEVEIWRILEIHGPFLAGHVSVLVRSGGREAVITGDALHSSVQCRHPDWHFRFDADAEMAVASRRRLLEDASETRRLVLGSHFALPSLGRVEAGKEGFRWVEKAGRTKGIFGDLGSEPFLVFGQGPSIGRSNQIERKSLRADRVLEAPKHPIRIVPRHRRMRLAESA